MFIPRHLIIEEQRRQSREQQADRRIPLYAPQRPQQATVPEPRPHDDNPESRQRRGAIVIDLNDYTEIED